MPVGLGSGMKQLSRGRLARVIQTFLPWGSFAFLWKYKAEKSEAVVVRES